MPANAGVDADVPPTPKIWTVLPLDTGWQSPSVAQMT